MKALKSDYAAPKLKTLTKKDWGWIEDDWGWIESQLQNITH